MVWQGHLAFRLLRACLWIKRKRAGCREHCGDFSKTTKLSYEKTTTPPIPTACLLLLWPPGWTLEVGCTSWAESRSSAATWKGDSAFYNTHTLSNDPDYPQEFQKHLGNVFLGKPWCECPSRGSESRCSLQTQELLRLLLIRERWFR